MDLLKPVRSAYRAMKGEPTGENSAPYVEEQGREQLVIMGVPRAWLRRGIQDRDFGGLFDQYLGELRTSINQVYGGGFEERREERTHRFLREGISIDYTAFTTAHGGTAAVYAGNLVLEEPTIDLQRASQLVKSVLGHKVIAYQETEPEFMIFHSRKGESDQGTLNEGRPLLKSLGIDLTEGCKFHFGGGVAVWYPVEVKLKAVAQEG